MVSLGNLMILGDSYSTFEGHIPQGYDPYYSSKEDADTDVRAVEETWWHQLASETNSNLVINSSYSGTTVGNTGWGGKDYKEISFIARFQKLSDEGFFKENKIDTLLIFGGTNDSWCDAPIGEAKFSDISFADTYCVLPAFSYLLNLVKSTLPYANINVIINTGLKPQIKDGFIQSCNHFNIPYLCLHDIDKMSGHPGVLGMKQIKTQVLEFLK